MLGIWGVKEDERDPFFLAALVASCSLGLCLPPDQSRVWVCSPWESGGAEERGQELAFGVGNEQEQRRREMRKRMTEGVILS